MIGALSAVEDVAGVDAVDSDIVVGTSAGSVLAALRLVRHHHRRAAPPPPGQPRAGRPRDRVGLRQHHRRPASAAPVLSARLAPAAARALRHPRRVGPMLALRPRCRPGAVRCADPATRSRRSIAVSRAPSARDRPVSSCRCRGSSRPTTARARGSYSGATCTADLPAAVVASCAIPAWYAPVTIDGGRYIDGGTVSNTSATCCSTRRWTRSTCWRRRPRCTMSTPGAPGPSGSSGGSGGS